MEGVASITVLDAAGDIMDAPSYDIRQHGSASVKAKLVEVLQELRAQAEVEVLP